MWSVIIKILLRKGMKTKHKFENLWDFINLLNKSTNLFSDIVSIVFLSILS